MEANASRTRSSRLLPALAGLAVLLVLSTVTAAAAAPPPEAVAQKLEGDRLRDLGDAEGARKAYEAALLLDARYAEALTETGSLAFAAGDLATALSRFRAAIAADPGYALAHYNLGYASRKAGAFRDAAAAYRAYVGLAPDDPDGYWGLAESLRGTGDRLGAADAYDQYVARERRESEREYVEKAQRFSAELRAQEAEARAFPPPLKTGPAADPALALQKMKEGDDHAAAGRFREALFAYQDAAAADPGSPDVLYRLGLGYARLNYFREAAEKWRATIASPRASPSLRSLASVSLEKAQARLGQARPGPAQETAALSTGTAPTTVAPAAPDARASYERGNRLYAARSYGEAIAAYTEALALRPDHAFAYLGRANSFLAQGALAEARRDAEAAVRLAPGSASPLYTLAMVLERQGDRTGAAARYREYAASSAADANPAQKEAASRKAAALVP